MYSKKINLLVKEIRRYAIQQLILEPAKTARKAVQVTTDFIEKYGQVNYGSRTGSDLHHPAADGGK